MDAEMIKYFDGKFETVHQRINDLDEKVDEAKLETCTRLTKLETEYKNHAEKAVANASKRWKVFSIFTSVALGILGFAQGINLFG